MTDFLIKGEEILYRLDYNVVLTNFRLRYRSENSSKAHVVTMMLESVSAIEIRYISKFFYKVLAALSLIGAVGGFLANEQEVLIGAVVSTLVFGLLFWFSRRHVISICPNGGMPVNVRTRGMAFSSVIEFVNAVEAAKRQNYVGVLHYPENDLS